MMNEIINKEWVWPYYDGVKGFSGTGEVSNNIIFWITERPSLHIEKLGKIDKLFYKILKEEGFSNIHLTDFVKKITIPGKIPSEEELKEGAKQIRKEIKKLTKKNKRLLLITNTKNVEKWMKEYFPELGTINVKFFKWRYFKNGERTKYLRKVLKEIMKEELK